MTKKIMVSMSDEMVEGLEHQRQMFMLKSIPATVRHILGIYFKRGGSF